MVLALTLNLCSILGCAPQLNEEQNTCYDQDRANEQPRPRTHLVFTRLPTISVGATHRSRTVAVEIGDVQQRQANTRDQPDTALVIATPLKQR